jgi:hypothetical protein
MVVIAKRNATELTYADVRAELAALLALPGPIEETGG